MDCWEMTFWLLVVLAGVEVVSLIVRGFVVVQVVKQCKTLAEAEEAARQLKPKDD